MSAAKKQTTRLERQTSATLQNWREPHSAEKEKIKKNAEVDCGWGRLLFAHTFTSQEKLISRLSDEEHDKRDIAFYARDPHVVVSKCPDELFIDPSNTYRLWLNQYKARAHPAKTLFVRRIQKKSDIPVIQTLLSARGMIVPDGEFLWKNRNSKKVIWLVVADVDSGDILGAVNGVDHVEAFSDPEGGCSLWSLTVSPHTTVPGVGETLVRYLCEHFIAKQRIYLDLSVMHSNSHAVALYEKLGMERVPVFCIKRKNVYNESLYTPITDDSRLNPYARIITTEARRRGIRVDVVDHERNYFYLSSGGRKILCWESLSELTSAVTMSICSDKALTHRFVERHGISTPKQREAGSDEENKAFLELHKRVVVKPAVGEQGQGIAVDVRTEEELSRAVRRAKSVCSTVLLEELVAGTDLRLVVINYEVVAAAIRRPAEITGDGTLTIDELIKKQSRRRAAATGGESKIPLDSETTRCVQSAGYEMGSVLPSGESLAVRKTANLHTGGTIHDVTDYLHPELRDAAVTAAKAISIPVTGLDFIVPSVEEPTYWFIEANERPGLENHQPQPTAERFVDLLFPDTIRQD